MAEGLDSYEKRIRLMKNEDLRDSLLDLMVGIRSYHKRCLDYLKSEKAEEKLISALEKVPFSPASNAYEALVATNFVLCLDGCDNIGFVEDWLPKYWNGEDLSKEMRSLMSHLHESDGWSITIGATYSELTKQWLLASEGLPRPLIELRTTPDMPDDIWETAIQTVLKGNGQPSFYNETAIQNRLTERFPNAPKEDIYQFAGMGCTETSFSGMTYSGGIDVNLNVLKIFDRAMREDLALCYTFDEFYEKFITRLHKAQDNLIKYVNNYYNKRGEICFQPLRTLFMDDCIAKEKGYLQGGARYTFAVPSDSGMPNTIDSLLAVRELIYNRKEYTPHQFIAALDSDDPRFFALLKSCPFYGVGNPDADELVHNLTHRFYSYYRNAELTLGDGFLPTSHQFVRHTIEGSSMGKTPDGRKDKSPVADSIAAMNGKAIKGPTMMLKSAASYDQSQIYGIPVLNLSITQKFDAAVLRALIEGYFEMGGTQIQITCANRETLLDAKKNPDAHRDLIVRVGGFSDYFHRLNP
ncbi:MAG: hypothetical protein IKU24_02655, partial [Clostridia bacterium]|nr:hypothetical protein [Clostridia bacterium]